jgi:hypothetical protein
MVVNPVTPTLATLDCNAVPSECQTCFENYTHCSISPPPPPFSFTAGASAQTSDGDDGAGAMMGVMAVGAVAAIAIIGGGVYVCKKQMAKPKASGASSGGVVMTTTHGDVTATSAQTRDSSASQEEGKEGEKI